MSGGYTFDPQTMIMHPKYNDVSGDYDIAVIKLKTPIITTKRSKRVTLPFLKCTVPEGTNLTVAGWGRTSVSIIRIRNTNYAFNSEVQETK